MTPEQNKTIVRRLVEEAINQANLAVFDELTVAEVEFDAPPGIPRNREGWKQNRLLLQQGIPDAHWHITEMLAEGDMVACRFQFHGTHSGDLFGIPPTGKPINITGTSLLRLQDGRITWQRINNDDLGMMSQLGLFALPENGNGSDGRRA